jgi:RimJ/RimL family protein N-acetyltransferase
MTPVPKFSNAVISLRPFTPDDTPALHSYLNHPDLAGRRYIHWDFSQDLPLPPKQVSSLIDKWNEAEEGVTFAVTRQADGALLGHCSSSWGWDPHMPDCSVVVAPRHQRQGVATQALSLLLDYLFDFTIAHNVSLGIMEWNQPALDFAKKIGFTRVGLLRRESFYGGKFCDEVILDLLRPEWKERRHAA